MKRNRENCSNYAGDRLITSVLVLCVSLTAACRGQSSAGGDPLSLYRQLLQPTFNVTDVHHVRGVAIDREDLHIVLTDGVMGLMQAVDGHVTGAFFEGDGEILLFPPDRAERTSLALFTHSGVLDTQFQTAYLRFFDDKLVEEFRGHFRPEENPGQHLEKWKEVAVSLAPMDGLQLLQAITNATDFSSRFLHMRLAGGRLGVFDVFFNTNTREQINVSQSTDVNGSTYYDAWTAFPMRSAREAAKTSSIQSWIHASEFHIHSKISPPTNLEGETEFTLTSSRSGQRTVVLQLSRNLKVTEIQLDGRPVQFVQNEAISGSDLARHGNDLVAIVLSAPLEKDRPAKLAVKYSGPVMFDAGGDLLYVGSRGTWYASPGPGFSNFDLTFEYPAGWTLVATGKRISSSTQNGTTSSHFVSDRPIAHAGFNLGKFQSATSNFDNVVIDAYAASTVELPLTEAGAKAGLRPDPAKDVENVAHQAAATVQFLSGEMGTFPYSHLEVSQLPALMSQSWPGLIYLSSLAFLTPQERVGLGIHKPFVELLLGELMLAHETAHQWWGDAVEWESYRDEWIIEGLANYCAALMLEREDPQKMKVILEHYHDELLTQTANGMPAEAGPVTLGPRLTSSKFPDGYEIVLYGRGTWICHMLRTMLRQASGGSDKLFFTALKDALAKSSTGKISTRDLQQAFEQVLPSSLFYEGRRSLDWFFDGWVNGAAIPSLSLHSLRFVPAASSVKVKGTIRQENSAKDMVTAVPLYAVDKAGNSSFLAFVFADEAETDFELTAPAGTTGLLLDPENSILRR